MSFDPHTVCWQSPQAKFAMPGDTLELHPQPDYGAAYDQGSGPLACKVALKHSTLCWYPTISASLPGPHSGNW